MLRVLRIARVFVAVVVEWDERGEEGRRDAGSGEGGKEEVC